MTASQVIEIRRREGGSHIESHMSVVIMKTYQSALISKYKSQSLTFVSVIDMVGCEGCILLPEVHLTSGFS